MKSRPRKTIGLALERACTDEDGEQEDEFDERKRDEHRGLHLADGFRLSCHALHSGETDETEANSATKCGHSECDRKHVFLVSPVSSSGG